MLFRFFLLVLTGFASAVAALAGASNGQALAAQFNFSNSSSATSTTTTTTNTLKKSPQFKLKLVHRDDIISSAGGKKSAKTTNGRPVRFYLPIYEVAPAATEKEMVTSTVSASIPTLFLRQNRTNFDRFPAAVPKGSGSSGKKATLWLFSDLLTSESAQTNSFHRAQHHQQQGHLFKQINGGNKNNNLKNHNNNNNQHHHHQQQQQQHRHPNQINSRPARDNFNNNNNNNQRNRHPNQLDQRAPVKNGHQGPPVMMTQNGHSNGHMNGHQNRQNLPNENAHRPQNRPNQPQQKPFQGPPRQNLANQEFNHPPNGNNNGRNQQQNHLPPNMNDHNHHNNGNHNKNFNGQSNLNNQNQNQHFRPPMNHSPPNNSRQHNLNNHNNFPNHRPHSNSNHNQISKHPINKNNEANNAPPMQNGNGKQNDNNNNHHNNIINHINDHLNNPKPPANQPGNPPNNNDRPDHHNNNRPNNHNNNNNNKHRDKYTEEVQSHNLDSDHFPHQYAIQIRWGKPGELSELAKSPDDNKSPPLSASPAENGRKALPMEDRTMNDEKSRYRQFAHQEEEHWHDKKWINLGAAPKEVDDVSSLPENDQLYAVSQEKFKTLPVYVRPLRNDASMETVHEHFAVPSRSFPVNRRFVEWANAPVQMRSHRMSVDRRGAESRRSFETAEEMGRNNRRKRQGHWRRMRRF